MELFVILIIVMWLVMTAWFLLALFLRNNSIVDIAWGLGFVVVAAVSYVFVPDSGWRGFALLVMATLWGLRLASYIFIRNWGRGEDFRYQAMRERWGNAVIWKSYVYVFLLQGFLLLVVSLPVSLGIMFSQGVDAPVGLLEVAGIVIWLFGLVYETVADYQMLAFKSDPMNKGRIMRYGLWKLSRHPNYFGEMVLWWGVWLFAVSASPQAIMAIIGPLTINYMLLRVSGVPMLEAKYKDNPEYMAYISTTPSVLPRLR